MMKGAIFSTFLRFRKINFFFQILEHFVATAPIGRTHVQLLLTLLHKSRCQINYNDLPKRVESLMAVPEILRKEVQILSLVPDPSSAAGQFLIPSVGELLYFGVAKAIEGRSSGLDNKWRYVKDLSLIDAINPEFLTGPFKNLLRESNLSMFSVAKPPTILRETAEQNTHERPLDEPLCVFLDFFADGFLPYKDCAKSYWMVSALISKFGRRISGAQEFHYTKCKPFIYQ